MNLSNLKKLSLGTRFSMILAIAILAFGVFITVRSAQQNQENRSRAAGSCTTYGTGPVYGNVYESDCTISYDFQGNLFGSRVTITGAMTGNIQNETSEGNLIMKNFTGNIVGSGNEVCGSMIGNLTGNNNIIHGSLLGNNTGTGNIINSTASCGVVRVSPTPTSIPTPTPTNPPATCADGIDNNNNGAIDSLDPICHTDGIAKNPDSYDPNLAEIASTCVDGIDNNQNELIDAADPACHTDGNPSNSISYDPNRNEGPVAPTITQSPTITPLPTTPAATSTPVPTVTIPPGNTSLKLTLLLHGIGKGGDSANPTSGGNPNPLRPQRNAKVEIYNSENQLVLTKDGLVSFNSGAGNFTGTIDLGTTLTTGVYTVRVKTNQFLRTLVPGIQNLTAGQTNQLPVTILVNGDINGDNSLNILDYNILMGCYSDFLPAVSCSAQGKLLSDLDDDGDVNQFDYNLFLRELTNREGQ